MKAIISHDIDHLTVSEHYLKDLIVPKQIARSYIELFSGKINALELFNRIGDLLKNQWQHIEELHTFNLKHKVPTTYFIGVNQGTGLSYSVKQAEFWIHKMRTMGCDVNIHGISYETFDAMKTEFDLFKSILDPHNFGIRMHYIKKNDQTFSNMAKVGYLFDSSEMGFKAPYKIGEMWEFPFQIMDGYIIEKPKQWQSKNLRQACEETKKIIDKSFEMNLPFLGIDFHDRYFSKSHQTWQDWYMWLVEYLVSQKIEFVNFKQAINELELTQKQSSSVLVS